MRTVLIDYDSGNLHSARKAFEKMASEVGSGEVLVTSDPDDVARADRVVLPGDGAFPHCRGELFARTALAEAVIEAVEVKGRPFMGICVGMQLMATTGHEYEETPGFGWIPGDIRKIDAPGQKVPHMGWNDLVIAQAHPVLNGIQSGDHAYFVHSFAMEVAENDHLLAHVDYGGPVTAIVGRDTIVGTQFHPEKSQDVGLRMIANFLKWAP